MVISSEEDRQVRVLLPGEEGSRLGGEMRAKNLGETWVWEASSYPGFNHKYSKTQNKESFGKTAGCYLPCPAKRGCQGVSKTVLRMVRLKGWERSMLPGQTEGPALVR